jgi:hypothetical protein
MDVVVLPMQETLHQAQAGTAMSTRGFPGFDRAAFHPDLHRAGGHAQEARHFAGGHHWIVSFNIALHKLPRVPSV